MRRFGRRRSDTAQADIVAALRGVGCSVTVLAEVGHGCPDLLVGRGGDRTVLMEVKTGRTDRLTPDEQKWHGGWRGGALVVVRTPAQALWAMGIETHEERAWQT